MKLNINIVGLTHNDIEGGLPPICANGYGKAAETRV